MLDANQPITVTLPAGAYSVILQLIAEAPYKVASPIIEALREQILKVDPHAFDPPPNAIPLVPVETPLSNGHVRE